MARKQSRMVVEAKESQTFSCETTDMMCPSCGCAVLVPDIRNWRYWWDGYETFIPTVRGLFCPSCDDVVTFDEDMARLEDLMLMFRKGVIEGLRK